MAHRQSPHTVAASHPLPQLLLGKSLPPGFDPGVARAARRTGCEKRDWRHRTFAAAVMQSDSCSEGAIRHPAPLPRSSSGNGSRFDMLRAFSLSRGRALVHVRFFGAATLPFAGGSRRRRATPCVLENAAYISTAVRQVEPTTAKVRVAAKLVWKSFLSCAGGAVGAKVLLNPCSCRNRDLRFSVRRSHGA